MDKWLKLLAMEKLIKLLKVIAYKSENFRWFKQYAKSSE